MQVAKWGNSLAVRLAKTLVEKMNLRPGDRLDIAAAADNKLVIESLDRRNRALANMRARRWTAPQGFKFDRDAANER